MSAPDRSWATRYVANDRAPREKRSALVRFLDLIGKAMFAIYTGSIMGIVAGLAVGAPPVAWLFLGATLCSAATAILANLFANRLGA